MTTRREILDFYAQPTAMTAAGRHAGALAALPRDLPACVAAIQGLLIHEHLASAHGVRVLDGEMAHPVQSDHFK